MKLLTALLFGLAAVGVSKTWIVSGDGSGDFTSIQDAIYESWHGDTIIVEPGVYAEDIVFAGRQITLTSENPDDPNVVAATILQGSITFFLGETLDSILQGFTIQGRVFPVSAGQFTQISPKIHGTVVVWQDARNYAQTGYDIYGIDLSVGLEFAVCVADSNQVAPDVYGDRVVWQDYRNDPNLADIYGLTLSTMQEFVVTSGAQDEAAPAIYGDVVVWHDNRGANYDIYGKNLVTQEALVVNTSSNNQLNPAISDVVVVWQDYRSGSRYDIYAKNIQTGSSYVVSNVATNKINPAISSTYIVWQDYRNGNADIYGKNRTTNTEVIVTNATNAQILPAAYEDVVVWEDYTSGNADIYGKNLTSGTQTILCSVLSDQTTPAICEDWLVWSDARWTAPITVSMDRNRTTTYSILCSYADATIEKNVIKTTEDGILGQYSAAPNIASNEFYFADTGIRSCHGLIEDNTLQLNVIAVSECNGQIQNNVFTYNDAAVSACEGTISSNVISYNNIGIYDCNSVISGNIISQNTNYAIAVCGGEISDNQIIGNGEAGIVLGDNEQTQITGNFVMNNAVGISGVTAALISENVISLNQGDGIVSGSVDVIRNNIISQNTGNGINYCGQTIRNNTVVNNGSTGILAQSGRNIKNNILAGNGGYGVEGGTISYNCFWKNTAGIYSGSVPGRGNVAVNPLFADADNGDYHLKSRIGRWDPSSEQWVVDSMTSRCVDGGDPADSPAQEPNPNGGRINMGVFGGTNQASLSPNGEGEIVPVCTDRPTMDFDGDCRVNLADFLQFAEQWLSCGLQPQEACFE